jgi:peptide/nickel transport system ATP-binding protein
MTDIAREDPSHPPETAITVEGLTIDFWNRDRWHNVVSDVGFSVRPGEAFGLVGESGCGKTTTAYALLGYERPGSCIRAGRVSFGGSDLLGMTPPALRALRGGPISFVPQNPIASLSPGMRIGDQIDEAQKVHLDGESSAQRRERTWALLTQVGLPAPAATSRKYPHQLSGGQQQRVVIAMALACSPRLIVLDEPTTGLDVTTQAQILQLLSRLRRERDMAIVYVTHDLSVVAQVCDRVGVMYAGELVESATAENLFPDPRSRDLRLGEPRHPYTRGLLASVPSVRTSVEQGSALNGLLQRQELPPGCRFAQRCAAAEDACFSERQHLEQVNSDHSVACRRWRDLDAVNVDHSRLSGVAAAPTGLPLLRVENLECSYPVNGGFSMMRKKVTAVVRNVSLDLAPQETLALVGESGSGKSTIAKTIAGLLPQTAGRITFADTQLPPTTAARTQDQRRDIQLVMQNPDGSLNPRQRVRQIIGAPLRVFFRLRGSRLRLRIEELLADVRLDVSYIDRYTDELSGGERQRIAIARALAAEPKLILCDEVLSALDVSVQASILELLRELRSRHRVAYLFISHDLAVVRSLAHRVGVLYRGELCEVGDAEEVYSPPYHPYTHLLLCAAPQIGEELPAVSDGSDSPAGDMTTSTGCVFADRCPWKVGAICDETPPPVQAVSRTHSLRCHIPLEELRQRETWSKGS